MKLVISLTDWILRNKERTTTRNKTEPTGTCDPSSRFTSLENLDKGKPLPPVPLNIKRRVLPDDMQIPVALRGGDNPFFLGALKQQK